MTSIFSKIIAGEIPSYKLYEDEYAYAFLDIKPIQEGHTLVVSKKEVDHLFDLDHEEYTGLMNAVKIVGTLLKTKLSPERIGVIVDGYEIAHAHVHLVPTTGPHQLDAKNARDVGHDALQKTYEKIVH